MRILLSDWAAQHFKPPPSMWTLCRLARQGDIYPPPIKVGSKYYVDPNARLMTDAPAVGVVEQMQGCA